MTAFEVTPAAAVQLRVLVRGEGVVGAPGVRLKLAPSRGPQAVELTIEDRREPGDEVHESQGIRFYLASGMAGRLGKAVLDVREGGFVVRSRSEPERPPASDARFPY